MVTLEGSATVGVCVEEVKKDSIPAKSEFRMFQIQVILPFPVDREVKHPSLVVQLGAIFACRQEKVQQI